jgi:polysaccharide export outer membrane protein
MGQYLKTCSTDGGSQMKKLTSLWSLVFLTLAATQLLSNCAQTNQPSTAAAGGQAPVIPSQNTQPVVANHANGVGGYANGQTAMAATTDAPQTNPAFANGAGTDYRISQQDILQISVFQVNDLNSAVQVSQDGNITLPLVGKVQVVGRTTDEAEQIIAGKLRQKYLQSPQVSVSVKGYGKRITVSGAVGGPRVLADDGNTTLSQAIANAGGVAEIGNAERVHVARSKDQHVQDDIYNLTDIQAGKVPDPLLKGGDIVVVEQSGVKVALKDLYSLMPLAIFAPLF